MGVRTYREGSEGLAARAAFVGDVSDVDFGCGEGGDEEEEEGGEGEGGEFHFFWWVLFVVVCGCSVGGLCIGEFTVRVEVLMECMAWRHE